MSSSRVQTLRDAHDIRLAILSEERFRTAGIQRSQVSASMPVMLDISWTREYSGTDHRPGLVEKDNISRSDQFLKRPATAEPLAATESFFESIFTHFSKYINEVGVAFDLNLLYHAYIELIASDSSALLRLSIQQVSIQIHSRPRDSASAQLARTLAQPGASRFRDFVTSLKEISLSSHLCERIA